jgi:hypothetical protein
MRRHLVHDALDSVIGGPVSGFERFFCCRSGSTPFAKVEQKIVQRQLPAVVCVVGIRAVGELDLASMHAGGPSIQGGIVIALRHPKRCLSPFCVPPHLLRLGIVLQSNIDQLGQI